MHSSMSTDEIIARFKWLSERIETLLPLIPSNNPRDILFKIHLMDIHQTYVDMHKTPVNIYSYEVDLENCIMEIRKYHTLEGVRNDK